MHVFLVVTDALRNLGGARHADPGDISCIHERGDAEAWESYLGYMKHTDDRTHMHVPVACHKSTYLPSADTVDGRSWLCPRLPWGLRKGGSFRTKSDAR